MIEVLKYPHQILLEKSTPWHSGDKIDGHEDIEKFEKEMAHEMIKQNGIGLAANQIGITKRFFCIGSDTFDTFKKPVIIWNPQIIKSSEEKVIDVEGCLSFPGIWVKVERPKIVEVMYETTQGKTRFAKLNGFESKCYQHEYDHIEGITFNQRVSKLRWDMAKKG
tara:strand:- start:3553 stop:4047 length:495 start_codon:yes stop_codon:yes gene_type:complete